MGKLKKTIFSQFAEFDCERQLFLNLGKKDNRWLDPVRKIEPLDPFRRPALHAFKIGKIYESEIYNYLKKLPNTRFSQKPDGTITRTILKKQTFLNFYDSIQQNGIPLLLIEYEFNTSPKFLKSLLGDLNLTEVPIIDPATKLRPDLFILSKKNEEIIFAFDGSKTPRLLSDEEREKKIAINIIDVKAVPVDSVGKKQLIEIIFYIKAIYYFLMKNDLLDRYYIDITGNGILPKIEDTFIQSIETITSSMVPLFWEESYRVFTDVIDTISSLRVNSPQSIESVSLHIQPACSRCEYLDDCKITLGCTQDSNASDWDVRLLPYTSRALVQQLNDKGFQTVGDVAENIAKVNVGSTPEAIYPQIPLLKLKSQSLCEQKEIYPQEGDIHSVSIPSWNELSLTVNVEQDPIHQRIMSIAFYLNMSVSSKAEYREDFNNLWRIVRQTLGDQYKKKESIETFQEQCLELLPNVPPKVVKSLGWAIWDLLELNKRQPDFFQIILEGENLNDEVLAQNAIINLGYTNINEGLRHEDEFAFIKTSIQKLFQILFICDFLEQHIFCLRDFDGKEVRDAPVLAIFYWSKEILEDLQLMLERHLQQLIFEVDVREQFSYIIQWFTPSESGIQDPNQHKKVFDLRVFVETILGFPAIINYTWHEIASFRHGGEINNKYWRPHFNYIDFKVWHEILVEQDYPKKISLITSLRQQMQFKVRTIDRLKRGFQRESRGLISREAKPKSIQSSRLMRLANSYHYIAQLWYAYAKLTAMLDEHEALYFRTMYPEFSIGKLKAAKVSKLREFSGTTDKRRYYKFQLIGLSSNMKLSEGDVVLLIPAELRDMGVRARYWEIKIRKLDWDTRKNCYNVVTEESNNRFFERLDDACKISESEQWYLYPKSLDAWSGKLYKRLLSSNNIGRSWLGSNLAFLWNLTSTTILKPEKLEFYLSSIYMFAPKLLEVYYPSIQDIELYSNVYPKPDQSQENAIKHALSRTISIIHGPPGTGKSQTIIALLDEFLIQKREYNRPKRILITSFSYPAMRVLVEKLRISSDNKSQPTKASKTDKLFVRSSYATTINNKNYPIGSTGFVHDLERNPGGTWKLNKELKDTKKRSITFTSKKKLDYYFPNDLIIFANAHQLYHLREPPKNGRGYKCLPDGFHFDLIIIDEASQLPTDYLLASLPYINNQIVKCKFTEIIDNDIQSLEEAESLIIDDHLNFDEMTKIVVVGDHNQLPPVQPLPPPKNLKKILGSLFGYYHEGHQLPSVQLEQNYRSHKDIVSFTSTLGFYKDLKAFYLNADRILTGKVPEGLDRVISETIDPTKVVSTIIHDRQFEIAVSPLECDIAVKLIICFYKMCNPVEKEAQIDFWKNEVGVVAPHNAQGRLIIRNLFEEMRRQQLSTLDDQVLMNSLRNTIYSVEKFQGSDRTLIIASVGISAKDQLSAEEDFIYDLNRFNVLTSRAKSKIILITSRNFLEYFPKRMDNVENVSRIRNFAFDFCSNSQMIVYNFEGKEEGIEYRWY